MGCMSASDAAPLPRLGEVYFDVRGESRSMRLSWYADTGVAVFSIWQGGTCTGTFRLPIADLPRMVQALQRGPHGHEDQGPAEPAVTGDRTGHARRPRPELLDSDVETGQTTAAIYLPPVTGNPDAYPDDRLAPGYRGEPMAPGYQGDLTGEDPAAPPAYRGDPLGAGRGRATSADLGRPDLPEYTGGPRGGGYGAGPASMDRSVPREPGYPGAPPAGLPGTPLAPEYGADEYHAELPAGIPADPPRRRRERPAPEYRDDPLGPDYGDDPLGGGYRADPPGPDYLGGPPGAEYRSDPRGPGYREEHPAPGYQDDRPAHGYRAGLPEPGYPDGPPGRGYPQDPAGPGYPDSPQAGYPDAPVAAGYGGGPATAYPDTPQAAGYLSQPRGEYPPGPGSHAYPEDFPPYPGEHADPGYGSPARPYVAGPPQAGDEPPGSGRGSRRRPRSRRGTAPSAESFPYGVPPGGPDPGGHDPGDRERGNREPGDRESRQRGRYR
jgi:hypothetical protein